MALASFDPLIARWFAGKFAAATEPQVLGWPQIRSGRDVLIAAPTGSGKTLAAFLLCLDELVRKAAQGNLAESTRTLYVSPLKALTNDVRKNLEAPLAELRNLAQAEGAALAPIRVGLRTGDTSPAQRREMLTRPPHILVTTPESLYLLLTAEKSRHMLGAVSTVIVDEIHALADDKRGSHLSLSLARLDHLIAQSGNPKPQRIGLSATVNPVDEVARFLSSDARIVDVGRRREMGLAVQVPDGELGAIASKELWDDIYGRLARLIEAHRTTLIFVNTRRLSERVAHALSERLGPGVVLPHHGSLSRELRLDAERKLKDGALRGMVATASLELGIDIGSIDLVVQVGSPRAIATAVQRIGRSGHWVGAKPEGVLFPATRDELIECAALVRAVRRAEMDRLSIPRAPLDILAQQIVAACAVEEWKEDDLYATFSGTYSYGSLSRRDFDGVVEMLSDGIAVSRGRSGALLHRDRVNGRIRSRRGGRLAAITCGGAIPDNAAYAVVVEPEGAIIGSLDEDFAVESMAGDIFLLGINSWRVRRVEPGRIRVEDAHGAAPSVPFWNGEGPGRTLELSHGVADLREEIERIARSSGLPAAEEFLIEQCGLDRTGAEQATAYVVAGTNMLGTLPSSRMVVAERFFDEAGGMQLVLHAPLGARINRAWGLALRKRFCRSFNVELQAAATDDGIVISLSEQHAFPLAIIFEFLKEATVEGVLTHALLASPMFAARWRWNASRSLAILRFRGGRKVAAPIMRMKADDLMAGVFPDQAACPENLSGEIRIPDHPLVNQTIADCLHEAMDLDGLKAVLRGIECGEIQTTAIDTAEPSPFAHEILNAHPYAYLDDAPLEERRSLAVQLRRTLPADVALRDGAFDGHVVAQVSEESWPVVRDADELHDALLTLIVLPPVPSWTEYFERLRSLGRATLLSAASATFWVAAERLEIALVAYPSAVLHPAISAVPSPRGAPAETDAAATEIVRGWLESGGPVTAAELAQRFCLPQSTIDAALLRIETDGQVLRGSFTGKSPVEWCNRRVLARIHRLTLGRLRREIEPVSSAQFVRFLGRWQHVTPGTRLHGVDGTLQVLRQMEGYEIPAAAWEGQVLPARVSRYRPEYLDQLCRSGEVMWGRLSPHPAFVDGAQPLSRRVRPTRAAPIAIFMREHADVLAGMAPDASPALSASARAILEELRARGALFFPDILRVCGRLPSEAEDALWELVAAGLVTADGFDNLRSLVSAKRRLGVGWRNRRARPRNAPGRWALLRHAQTVSPDAEFFARRLLARWGVVFRDLLTRETLIPPWRELLTALRRLEDRGEIRGGRFVSGFVGEQFCLPEALDLLRALRRGADALSAPQDEPLSVNSADPLNLVGIILPGQRISPSAGSVVRIPLPSAPVVAERREAIAIG
ncbi:MAG: DEAD/DEAH box helicase [Candidatus Eremiobacteraeota bacterium]|nr:DEAD/DEAH box helicase [Candidatus Eremiobacteraeota bacterium]MBC5827883.1 DEAD/DEAH box helicase [Candidatus Eremiobacteraeota bacterium]